MKASALFSLVAAIPLLLGAPIASAQSTTNGYPNRAIKLVVPFAAGGSSDVLARAVAKHLSDGLGQPVIVDNKPGAGGFLGLSATSTVPADGYTLLFTTNGTHSIGPALYPSRKIDPLTAFEPVAWMHTLPNMLLVNPKVPAANVQELIAYAKANPGKLTYASAGSGSASHLFGELFKTAAGVNIMHVPYRGGSAAIPDVVAGQVSMIFETIPNALTHVRSGTLRALAVTSAKRSTAAPDIPTIAEAALPGFEAISWSGLSAPAGTPKAILARLNEEANRVSRVPVYLDLLKSLGVEPVITTPEAMAQHNRSDLAKWKATVEKAHIQVE